MRRAFTSFAILSLTLAAPSLHGQMPPSSSSTSTPVPGVGHDYIGEIAETVNPATGSLSIRVGVPIAPGRGITLPFSFAYDSAGVNYVSNNSGGVLQWLNPSKTIVSSGGWSNTVPVVSVSETTWTAVTNLGRRQGCFAFVNYEYQDAHGDRHNLNLSTYNQAGNPNGACTYDSADWPPSFSGTVVRQKGEASPGAIMALIPSNATTSPGPVTVVDTDGTTFNFPNVNNDTGGSLATSIEDRNGNIVTIHPPVSPSTNYNYVDTAGRTVLQDTGFGISPEIVTVAGLGGTYSLQWTALSTPTFSVPVTTVSGNACNFGGSHQAWSGQNAISSLTLPNGMHFTFAYDPTYRLISKMTYPSGGYIRYVWGVNSQAELGSNTTSQSNAQCTALYGMPVITDRYVSFDGSTETLHQQFQYSTVWNLGNFSWTSKKTTVTTSDLVRGASYTTMYTYSPLNADHPPNSGPPTKYDPVESSVQYNDFNGTTIKTVSKTWLNPRLLSSETVSYPTGQASETTWTYNSREQEIEKDEYDYGSNGVGSLLRKTVTNYQQFNLNLYPNAPSIADKPCQVIIYDGTGTNRVTETDYFYDNGATGTPCGAAGTPAVTPVSGLTGHDETNYSGTSTNPRGNLTEKTQWLNTGPSPVTTYTYDETGQILSLTDPCGNAVCADMAGSSHTTNYSYADRYTILSGGQNVSYTPSGNTNALLTALTDPIGHTSNFTYDFNNAQLTISKDQNDISGSLSGDTYIYNDAFARPTLFQHPDTGQSSFSYNDSSYSQTNNTPNVQRTLLIVPGTNFIHTTARDGIEHAARALLNSDPVAPDTGDKTYDGSGLVRTKSNSHRPGSSSTDGTATYTYDALGRLTNVVQPDGSTWTTTYSVNCNTVTDEAGKVRKSCSDALGRLTQVLEDPNTLNYETDYTYDAVGNLLTVNQKGGDPNSADWRTRTFSYDSLSRLITAANPETGTICYGTWNGSTCVNGYDANGNLSKKADARGIAITYSYDVLNRLTSKTYSNGDPSVSYAYDAFVSNTSCGQNGNFGIGRRTGMTDGSGSTTWTYDTMGRVWSESRTVGIVTKTISTCYNPDGSVTHITYPSGSVLTYSYNSAAQLTEVSDTTHNITYFQGASYFPTGELNQATYGSVVETSIYNNRLQPCWYYATTGTPLAASTACSGAANAASVLDLKYNFGFGANDNGNVWALTNDKDSNRSVIYTYDALNRIASATTPNTDCTVLPNGITRNWGESFTFDAWGNLKNLSTTKCSAELLSVVPLSNNRLSGFGYDADGNMTQNGTATYTYDAESRLASAAGVTYTYNGDGERVKKSNGTLYWGTGPLLESDLSGNLQREFIFAGGERVARRDISTGSVYYYFSDHLGSADVVTNSSGTIQNESDYYPYGGERVYSQALTNQNYKFTGKERDAESSLDDFDARFYANAVGRFMQPDWSGTPESVPYASFENPQTLNLYSYVQNNPTTLGDPSGHQSGTIDQAWEGVKELVDEGAAEGKEMIRSPKAAGGRIIGGAVAFYVGAMLNPKTVGQSDADEMKEKARLQQEKNSNEDKEGAEEKKEELQTSTDGAKKKGGGQKPIDPDLTKTADDLISGSGKSSKSYHSGLGGLTKQQIFDKAAKGDKKAQQMKKLIQQRSRLQQKTKNKPQQK